MRTLSPRELLEAWEEGLRLPPQERGVALLTMACRDSPDCDPAEYSIGKRDSELLTLRERTFGSDIQALVRCPKCEHALELQFRASDIRAESSGFEQASLTFAQEAYRVSFRLPNSNDLRRLRAENEEVTGAVQQLLRLCVLEARCDDREVEVEHLPGAVLQAVVERMGEADPQATVELSLDCADCRHEWQQSFDIESFFWSEIRAWAERILREIHQLASAYGWSEGEILALTPLRRSLYLNYVAE